MIRILVIDDTEQKVAIIKSSIDKCFIPSENVDVATCLNDGRNLLCENNYDLLILDLLLPHNEGDEPDGEISPSFINEISENPHINIPLQIIGITQFDEMYEQRRIQYEDKVWALLKYDQASNNWKQRLETKINQLYSTKKAIAAAEAQKNKYYIGIVCALNDEFIELKNAFNGDWLKVNDSRLPFDVFRIIVETINGPISVVATCVGSPGVVATSIVSTTIFNLYNVDYMFMTGFCAGFSAEDIRYGDIVISESIQDYGNGKITEDDSGMRSILKEIHQIPASNSLLSKMRSFLDNRANMMKINTKLKSVNLLNDRETIASYIAPTVCGPYVVTSSSMMENLKKDSRKLKSLDMEGYGLYLTSHILDKKCLWIKSIADFADKEKGDDYHKMCSAASAYLLYYFIKDEL